MVARTQELPGPFAWALSMARASVDRMSNALTMSINRSSRTGQDRLRTMNRTVQGRGQDRW